MLKLVHISEPESKLKKLPLHKDTEYKKKLRKLFLEVHNQRIINKKALTAR